MLWTIFVLAVGIIIGWAIPQPAWATAIGETVVDLGKKFIATVKDKMNKSA